VHPFVEMETIHTHQQKSTHNIGRKMSTITTATTTSNTTTSSKDKLLEMTSKDYYFDSYSHFGIHEGKFPHTHTHIYKQNKIEIATFVFVYE
jgi:hypothetical protein